MQGEAVRVPIPSIPSDRERPVPTRSRRRRDGVDLMRREDPEEPETTRKGGSFGEFFRVVQGWSAPLTGGKERGDPVEDGRFVFFF